MELSLYIKDKLVSGKRVAIPIMTHPGIELLGKQVSDAVTNGEIHYHAIRALNECFPQSAACTTIMDLTVEAEAFGARLSMSPNEVPSVCALDMQMLRLCRFLRSNRDACLSICWPTAWQQKE